MKSRLQNILYSVKLVEGERARRENTDVLGEFFWTVQLRMDFFFLVIHSCVFQTIHNEFLFI